MCLSVYLGTSRPLSSPQSLVGHLDLEQAAWTPPPLRRGYKFVYYLGSKSEGSKPLGCSCLLFEYVEWNETDPVIRHDDTYPAGACPFDTLRKFCEEATRDGGVATIVCDDSGGVEQDCSDEDYCTGGLVRLDLIARNNLLFADAAGDYPWRVLHVVR